MIPSNLSSLWQALSGGKIACIRVRLRRTGSSLLFAGRTMTGRATDEARPTPIDAKHAAAASIEEAARIESSRNRHVDVFPAASRLWRVLESPAQS